MESIPPEEFYSSASSRWIFLGLVSALRDECSLHSLYVDIVHGKDPKGNVNVQAVALISEMILLTVLALSLIHI